MVNLNYSSGIDKKDNIIPLKLTYIRKEEMMSNDIEKLWEQDQSKLLQEGGGDLKELNDLCTIKETIF